MVHGAVEVIRLVPTWKALVQGQPETIRCGADSPERRQADPPEEIQLLWADLARGRDGLQRSRRKLSAVWLPASPAKSAETIAATLKARAFSVLSHIEGYF